MPLVLFVLSSCFVGRYALCWYVAAAAPCGALLSTGIPLLLLLLLVAASPAA